MPHPIWSDTLAARDEALRNRHMKEAELWTVHTRRLPPLAVSQHLRIQIQTGPHPNKWNKTGVIIEVHQFDQYVVHVDGFGRITLYNRKFLRRYVPVQAPQPRRTIHDDFRQITKLLAKPAASPTLQPTCTPTTLASDQPTPEPPPSQGPKKYSSHCPSTPQLQLPGVSSQHSTLSYPRGHQSLLWSPTRPSPTHGPPL